MGKEQIYNPGSIDLHRRDGILMLKDVSKKAFVMSCLSKRCTLLSNLPSKVVFRKKTTVTRSQSLSRREMSMVVSSRPKGERESF